MLAVRFLPRPMVAMMVASEVAAATFMRMEMSTSNAVGSVDTSTVTCRRRRRAGQAKPAEKARWRPWRRSGMQVMKSMPQ